VFELTFANLPRITIPGNVNFADTCLGSTSVATLSVCNTGTANLEIGAITSGNSEFTVVTPSSGYPVVISPDFCFPFQVTFTPTSTGSKSATLTIKSNDPINPSVTVQVTGNAPPPDIHVTGSTDFGDVCGGTLAEKLIQVCNEGNCDLNVVAVFNPPCADFTLINSPFPSKVKPGECKPLTIRFTPTLLCGQKSCTLVITSDDPDTSTVTLAVTANTPCSSIDVPPDQCFPPTVIQSVGACSSLKPFPISNTGTCPLVITAITLGGANPGAYSLPGLPSFPVILQAGHIVGEGNLKIAFAPTVLSRNTLATISVTYIDPVTGAPTTVTRTLNGEGVRTGARVLVTTSGGLAFATVEKIQLQRINANRNKNLLDTVDNALNVTPTTVTPALPCAPFQYHREYSTVANPIQLLPGSYQVTATALVGKKRVSKTVGFNVDTCGFNANVVISLP
jgi:hypothetical protein